MMRIRELAEWQGMTNPLRGASEDPSPEAISRAKRALVRNPLLFGKPARAKEDKMKFKHEKEYKRYRRHLRVRSKITGDTERPRLCVFRSLRHIYAQIIDDSRGQTLASASSLKLAVKSEEKMSRKLLEAKSVGKAIAETAKEKGITRVKFDRGGYLYHGRVAALADAAREAGLEF